MKSSYNTTKYHPISVLKKWIVPVGRQKVTIPFGIFRGLHLNIDFKSQAQVYLGLWEFETYPYIRRALNNAHWIIDAGAGFGELCILFRKKCCQTIAIEPDEKSLSVLSANMALNGISETD